MIRQATTIDAYRPEAVAERVAALAQEHGVEELVLGHPINMDGTRGPRSEKAQAMKVLLEETSSLPVILWDERRTILPVLAKRPSPVLRR